MEYKVTVILLLVTTFECNGHLDFLGGILSNARERVQTGVEGVAGAVLGGLNFNFGGHLDFNKQNRPQDVPQNGPDETVIVVVEENDQKSYGSRPSPHGQGPPLHHGPPPPPHHNYGPPPPPHHNHGPPLHHNHGPPPPPHHNHGPPPPPHHHHGPPPPPHHNHGPPMHHEPPPHHHHHQRPHDQPGPPRPGYNDQTQRPYDENNYYENQNTGNPGNNNFNGNNQNMRPNENNNHNGYQPYPQGHHNYNEDNNQKNPNGQNTKPFYDNPTTEYNKITESIKTSPSPKDEESNKVTGTTDDFPLFVPLNPDEYVYGGDKINITAPKRDTEKNKPAESDDEDFAIDIRLKN